MKPTKVAAIVAGSLMAAGVASPAVAVSGMPATSLNGAVGTVAAQTLRGAQPLQTRMLDTSKEGSLVKAVSDTANTLNKVRGGDTGKLLGGLPLEG
ncbi:hypothetical protein GCM10020367_28310 [Streptomyces sannanensis]|uniref:Secreted protein n=1 Tax=Streptomyces sannanensis TaxID=285536 RepID=A0ABP6SBD5_9ACTN